MAEETLASAVSVPQLEELESVHDSPDAGMKRRQSSVSENGSKRRRISDVAPSVSRQSPSGQTETNTRPARRTTAVAEERKRGQRLFGGLLGTLSQTSSTAAQRRRADIEQRQQTKLKQQDEKHSEAKRRKKEEVVAERRKRQRELESASMAIRHRNLLQSANFLRTKVEPVLLWRPFQLRDADEDTISRQRQEARETISKEETEFEQRWRQQEQEADKIASVSNGDDGPPEESNEASNEQQQQQQQPDTSLDEDQNANNEPDQEKQPKEDAEKPASVADTGEQRMPPLQRQDDEEVMEEDKEDIVLY